MSLSYQKTCILLFGLILLLTTSSCSKKKNESVVAKDTSNLTYIINNIDAKTDSCVYIWYKELNNFRFEAYLNGYLKISGDVYNIPLTIGTFPISSTSTSMAYFPTISILGYSIAGTLTITSIDEKNKLITGSFSGTCIHNNITDVLTNGKFIARNKYK